MDSKACILVVEDSKSQQIFIRAYLEQQGFEVRLADNGNHALRSVRDDPPDMVVTDLQMPEMDGLELVAALQREFQKLPVVLITAKGSEQIAAAALRAGASSYVPKKHLQSDLGPTIARVLAILQAERANMELGECVTRLEVEYEIDKDTIIPLLIAKIRNDLRPFGFADENELVQIAMALDEAFMNAVVHGNLEVPSHLRSEDDGNPYRLLIEERKTQAPYCDRRVFFHLSADRGGTQMTIRDEGPGFDPSSIADPTDPQNLQNMGGRGLMLINAFMTDVYHNPTGNEITMVKRAAVDGVSTSAPEESLL